MPQITQSFTVAFPRARVWPLLGDIAQVVPCMPGASLIAPVEGDAFAGQMRVKLGPIAATFAGQGTLTLDEASHSGTIQGQGVDAKSNSRAKGTVTFTVAEAEEGSATRVDLAVDFTLSGMLAQFSRGAIVQEIAQRLTAEFARNLEATLAVATPEAAPAPTRELNGGALLWAMLRDWVRGLLAGARRRGQSLG